MASSFPSTSPEISQSRREFGQYPQKYRRSPAEEHTRQKGRDEDHGMTQPRNGTLPVPANAGPRAISVSRW